MTTPHQRRSPSPAGLRFGENDDERRFVSSIRRDGSDGSLVHGGSSAGPMTGGGGEVSRAESRNPAATSILPPLGRSLFRAVSGGDGDGGGGCGDDDRFDYDTDNSKCPESKRRKMRRRSFSLRDGGDDPAAGDGEHRTSSRRFAGVVGDVERRTRLYSALILALMAAMTFWAVVTEGDLVTAPPRDKPLVIRYFDHHEGRGGGGFGGGEESVDRRGARMHAAYLDWGMGTSSAGDTTGDNRPVEYVDSSEEYAAGRADDFEEGDCVAMRPWQLETFPSCNVLHEMGTDWSGRGIAHERAAWWNRGYYRDVWVVEANNGSSMKKAKMVLKTLRYRHSFDQRNFERHRRDALAMERLTSSPHVVDIYGYCGVGSGVFEYSRTGDVYDYVRNRGGRGSLTKLERLTIAAQVAMGVTEVHTFEGGRQPSTSAGWAGDGHDDRRRVAASIAHTDVTPLQFILIDGHFKLNDFNRCRFIRWNERTNSSCPYRVAGNRGVLRSPEEYKYDPQTEKVDVYSMGNVIYFILTGKWPFLDIPEKKAKRRVMAGKRPQVPPDIRNSDDPVDVALLRAMEMCYVHDPVERASSREVSTFLKEELRKIKAAKVKQKNQ